MFINLKKILHFISPILRGTNIVMLQIYDVKNVIKVNLTLKKEET